MTSPRNAYRDVSNAIVSPGRIGWSRYIQTPPSLSVAGIERRASSVRAAPAIASVPWPDGRPYDRTADAALDASPIDWTTAPAAGEAPAVFIRSVSPGLTMSATSPIAA